jgi:uncharacterized protein (DUF1778 family)
MEGVEMPTNDVQARDHITPDRETKDARINVRLAPSQASLIRQAAESQDKSLTDFIVTSAANAAEQVLADRRWFRLEESSWEVFEVLLDRPAILKPRLAELLASEDQFVD